MCCIWVWICLYVWTHFGYIKSSFSTNKTSLHSLQVTCNKYVSRHIWTMCHYLKVRFLALEDQVKPRRLYYLESFQVVTCRSREPYEWSHSKNVELILYLILGLNCWYLLQQIWANDEVPHSCAKCFPFPSL